MKKLSNKEKLSIILFYKQLKKIHFQNQTFYQSDDYSISHYKIIKMFESNFEWLQLLDSEYQLFIISEYIELVFFVQNPSYKTIEFLQKNYPIILYHYNEMYYYKTSLCA